MKMLSLAPILRNKFLDLKYIRFLTTKLNLHSLEECRHWSLQNANVYRLQKYSTSNEKKDVTVSEDARKEISVEYESIKKRAKIGWYSTVVTLGVSLTCIILYELFLELFSGKSPHNVYTQAFDRCVKDEKVIFALGEPIKGFGEENRRGRRQHVRHLIYEKDGVNYVRMKFYVKGSRKTGTVYLEMKENDGGKLEYRYLFLQVDGYPEMTIVLEDNRLQNPLTPLLPLKDSTDLL